MAAALSAGMVGRPNRRRGREPGRQGHVRGSSRVQIQRTRPPSAAAPFRLARLAAKYGPEITLRDLTERFSYDYLWRTEARSKKGKSACGVYLPDLEHRQPPDMPPGMVKLRRVKSD